jgi:hypothetical protein
VLTDYVIGLAHDRRGNQNLSPTSEPMDPERVIARVHVPVRSEPKKPTEQKQGPEQKRFQVSHCEPLSLDYGLVATPQQRRSIA